MNIPIPKEVIDHFRNLPREPFEKDGFLTGRPFIDTVFKGKRVRAVGSTIFSRPLNETFHVFILNYFAHLLTPEWFKNEKAKPEEERHLIFQWFQELESTLQQEQSKGQQNRILGIKQSGNIRSLLATAYDFYSLKHCKGDVLPKLLNRLKDKEQFQGAKYEIAVGGIATRAGFEIEWVNTKGKHCEFIGTHKITGDKTAFEAKSHHREGVLGREGKIFDAGSARIKIIDHLKEALEQGSTNIPLIIFDDLNLPLTPGQEYKEKRWFKEVDGALERSGFLEKYKQTNFGALLITNFSWHFHDKLVRDKNEVMAIFHAGGKYSLKPETILQYLKLSAEQYGFVPPKLEEMKET